MYASSAPCSFAKKVLTNAAATAAAATTQQQTGKKQPTLKDIGSNTERIVSYLAITIIQ